MRWIHPQPVMLNVRTWPLSVGHPIVVVAEECGEPLNGSERAVDHQDHGGEHDPTDPAGHFPIPGLAWCRNSTWSNPFQLSNVDGVIQPHADSLIGGFSEVETDRYVLVTTRNPRLPVELSGVLALRAATR